MKQQLTITWEKQNLKSAFEIKLLLHPWYYWCCSWYYWCCFTDEEIEACKIKWLPWNSHFWWRNRNHVFWKKTLCSVFFPPLYESDQTPLKREIFAFDFSAYTIWPTNDYVYQIGVIVSQEKPVILSEFVSDKFVSNTVRQGSSQSYAC